MSLTIGTAPFGPSPGGQWNFEPARRKGVIWFEDSPRWVRGVLNGETVVDSRAVKLLHETGHLPVWYFPRADVRMELLEPSERTTRCPYKGVASYWTVRVNGREEIDAAWAYPEPLEDAPPLAEYIAFYWRAMDHWFEEDEEVFVHPRDPYHRVDVLDTSRHVRVLVDGEVVADTTHAKALFETGLPTRWYVPAHDVRTELLEPSDHLTRCPYKGQAEHRSVRVGQSLEEALVWRYAEPLREVAPIAGHWCFYQERCDLEIDGELQERPQTAWSHR